MVIVQFGGAGTGAEREGTLRSERAEVRRKRSHDWRADEAEGIGWQLSQGIIGDSSSRNAVFLVVPL